MQPVSTSAASSIAAPLTWDEEVDVVIVGSGFAGIAAAIEAKKAGCGVLVLEKMPTPGGNSVIDSGELSVVDSPQQKRRRVHDSSSLLAEDILTNGEHLNDPVKVRYIAEHAHDIYEWTRSLGVEWTEGVARAGGHSVPRIIVAKSGSGQEIYRCLAKHFAELGGTVRLSNYVEQIVRMPDTGQEASSKKNLSESFVQGVVVRDGYVFPDPSSGTFKRVRARKAVILCHGGFAADEAFRREMDPSLPENLGTTNQPGATGELWREAARIGCLILQAGWIQCTPWNNPKEQGQGIGWIFSEYAAAAYGIWVNQAGERFVNETANRKVRTEAIFEEHRHGRKVFCIANEAGIANLENLRQGYMADVLARGLVERFDNVTAMASGLGIDSDSLKRGINNFNAAVEKGFDNHFGRSLRKLHPLTYGPWYAAEMTPRVHHCMGGIMTDPQGRALDAATQKPIPGLFAAGECAGGVHGACRIGACAILDCLVMGRLAGAVASKP